MLKLKLSVKLKRNNCDWSVTIIL